MWSDGVPGFDPRTFWSSLGRSEYHLGTIQGVSQNPQGHAHDFLDNTSRFTGLGGRRWVMALSSLRFFRTSPCPPVSRGRQAPLHQLLPPRPIPASGSGSALLSSCRASDAATAPEDCASSSTNVLSTPCSRRKRSPHVRVWRAGHPTQQTSLSQARERAQWRHLPLLPELHVDSPPPPLLAAAAALTDDAAFLSAPSRCSGGSARSIGVVSEAELVSSDQVRTASARFQLCSTNPTTASSRDAPNSMNCRTSAHSVREKSGSATASSSPCDAASTHSHSPAMCWMGPKQTRWGRGILIQKNLSRQLRRVSAYVCTILYVSHFTS